MVKTRKEILEGLYDTFHNQKIQTEIVADATQSRILRITDPKAKEVVQKLEEQLAGLKISMGNAQMAMDRIMKKILEEDKIKK